MSPGPIVAGVDCGTNSTRLLVARRDAPATGDALGDGAGATPPARGLVTLERLMRITRLGEGVDERGALSDEAIGRTVAVLADYRKVCDRHGVGSLRVSATSAARDAANRERFFDAAAEVLGARPELLTGEEEARLSFVGATAELDPADGPFVVFDLGGGSTELAVGELAADGSPRLAGLCSVAVGCVRITEQFLHGDPPAPAELDAAVAAARRMLAEAYARLPPADPGATVVGLAGTVSTITSVVAGLADYDRERVHHATLTRAQVLETFDRLGRAPLAERAGIPGVEPGRAEVIVGGTAVLVAVFDVLGVDSLLVSESDILDGLAASAV